MNEQGFAMPMVIMLMVIMTFIAYAALLQANNGLNLAYKQAYIQMARTASKASIDYAQEQFDNSL
jgi:Tfp pilus assembly protein PilX